MESMGSRSGSIAPTVASRETRFHRGLLRAGYIRATTRAPIWIHDVAHQITRFVYKELPRASLPKRGSQRGLVEVAHINSKSGYRTSPVRRSHSGRQTLYRSIRA